MNTEAQKNPRSVIKKEDGFLAYYWNAQLANLIVRFTHKMIPSVTPDWFTATSFILGIAAAIMFAQGIFFWTVVGIITLHISFTFDCCDGQLARLTGMKIRRGAWFDYHSDKIKDGFLLLGFSYGAFVQTGYEWVFIIAFLGIFFQFLRNINALNRDIITMEVHGVKDRARTFFESKDEGSQFLRTLKHSSLFKLSDRVLLYTVFGLLSWNLAGIMVYTALAFFFSTASGLLNYKVFARFDKEKPL